MTNYRAAKSARASRMAAKTQHIERKLDEKLLNGSKKLTPEKQPESKPPEAPVPAKVNPYERMLTKLRADLAKAKANREEQQSLQN